MVRSIIIGLTLSLATASGVVANVSNMRCEYLVSPSGIATTEPRLTWEFTDMDNVEKCRVELAADSLFQHSVSFPSETLWSVKADIPAESATKYFWRVIATDNHGRETISPVSQFETGLLTADEWQAQWITDSNDINFETAPMFRKSFSLKEKPQNARAYVSALGYYVMTLNGRRVGTAHMDPGFTDYTKRSLYSTYDITDYLKEGDNEIVVTLGNGFANCQSRDAWGQEKAPWRRRPQFICLLTDNGKSIVATDESWQTAPSPVIYNNLYSGEHYDARRKSVKWVKAKVVDAPNDNLVSQSMPAIVPTRNLPAKCIHSWGDTIHVFDMGMNISGVCRLDVKGEKGTRIELSHGELLKKNGRLELGNLDIYYHPLKSDEAFQTDVYILGGNPTGESFQPEFTYHGFRYVELRSSQPVPADKIRLTGRQMRTGIGRAGNFGCSNELLNRIYDATMLSYEDNIHSIPTDCPQREKNGWTADAHVAIDLGLLNYDGITLYEKWMDDFADNQLANGNVSGIVPSAGWGYGDSPGPVWDAALFIVPLALYDYYGDVTALKKMYPVMLRYMDWLKSLEKEDGTLACGIGDWLPYDTQTPTDFTSTLYAFADYKMMARIAEILGEDTSVWLHKANEMKERINGKWFDSEKALYANGSQAAQGIALYWDVVPEQYVRKVAANLNDMVIANDYALDFGLLGSKSVLRMLTRYGYPQTALRMATRTSAPSWGHWIDECGYTTLAETWTLSPEFRDASLNHVFFGDIAAWMTSDIAGLNFDTASPGFSNIIIRPTFMDGLDWAEAEYHSVKGLIKTRWQRRADGKIVLSVAIPSGCSASIDIDGKIEKVSGGEHTLIV